MEFLKHTWITHVDILYPDIMDKNYVNISLKYIQQHILPQINLIGNC